jgi:hypothetical protein
MKAFDDSPRALRDAHFRKGFKTDECAKKY